MATIIAILLSLNVLIAGGESTNGGSAEGVDKSGVEKGSPEESSSPGSVIITDINGL